MNPHLKKGISRPKILILLMTLVCLLPVRATAQVNYGVSGSIARVVSSPNASGDIVIASNYRGYPVTSIDYRAFSGCTSLSRVTIPSSVTGIGSEAFRGCTSLTDIWVDADNPACSSLDGVLFNRAQTTLIAFPAGRGGSYAIPNSVTFITARAFSGCPGLTSVTIPSSVTAIDNGPFSGCTSLTNIWVEAANPAYSSLDGVLFHRLDFFTPSGWTLIAFPAGRSGSYVITHSIVTSIGAWAFDGCTSLTSVTISGDVARIGYNAFDGCTSLTGVAIGHNVTDIKSGAFSGCTSLTSFSVEAANPAYSSLNGVLCDRTQTTLITFPSGRGGNYVVPNSVTSIGNWAFDGCTNLTSATIGHSVTDIGYRAFDGCTGLTSVTIGNSVTFIGGSAFYNCTSLTDVSVDAANPAYSSLNGVLFDQAQTTLITFPAGRGGGYIIPNSVTAVMYAAFDGCTNLTSVTIGNSVTGIGSESFWNCTSLTNISVDAANPAYSSLNGVLFNETQTSLIAFPSGRGGNYIIPNSVTTIGNYAFHGCTSLTSVIIPNSVTGIRGGAFYGCTGLTSVTMPNSVTSIEGWAYSGCTSLSSVTFSGNAPELPVFVDEDDIGDWFANVGEGATVYYHYGTTGWGTTYGGLPTVMLGAPEPQIVTGSMGVTPGGYRFSLSGVVNQTIVVDASTDLLNWQPVWTKTLTGGSADFVDPQWLNHPHRFYRARSAP
jgi:hypothetical protein